MNPVVKKHLSFFQLLGETHRSQKRALLRTMTRAQLKAVAEIIYNILLTNVELTRAEKDSLLPYRHTLEFIVDKNNSWTAKRNRVLKKSSGIIHLLKIFLSKL